MKPNKTIKKKEETFKQGFTRRFLAAFDETMDREGLTAKSLCEVIGLAPQRITNMRSGHNSPTLENVVTLCDTYDYDLEYLVRGELKPGTRRPAPGATLEMIYEELQDLKEQHSNLVGKMMEAFLLFQKDKGITPNDWKKIFNKS